MNADGNWYLGVVCCVLFYSCMLLQEREEEVELSREERIGPGGLDPVEVFQSLPESMQEAFESQDTAKLQVRARWAVLDVSI